MTASNDSILSIERTWRSQARITRSYDVAYGRIAVFSDHNLDPVDEQIIRAYVASSLWEKNDRLEVYRDAMTEEKVSNSLP
jgi:hypothetical protein